MKVIAASDASLLIVFGDAISPELHDQVIALFRAVKAQDDARIRNIHPGYASVLIDFDPQQLSHEELEESVRHLLSQQLSPGVNAAAPILIPVCYEDEFGPDLGHVADRAKITRQEVIRLHSSADYFVYFLGFTPGFAYLGGLDARLHTPRVATPRKHVAAGTVGIAGRQTGIYPVDSAGGWQLIGRTPLRMFHPDAMPPARLQPGDRVKFHSIDRTTFNELARSHGDSLAPWQ